VTGAESERDDRRLVRACAWARLGLAHALLLLVPALPAELAPGANTAVLVGALLVAAAGAGAVLLAGGRARPRRVAALASLLDVAVVTAVVAATGGPRSLFSFLYVLAVVGACLVLPRAGVVALAAAGSLLYAGIVVARTVLPLTALLEPLGETTALEVLTMFLNAGTFLVVALVAGGLAERDRAARHELERHRRDLRDLEAFKAVVLNSVGAGLLVLDPEHRVTALNRAGEAITGWRAADAIGRPARALWGEGVPVAAIEAALAAHPTTPTRCETTLTRPDGTRVPVRLAFSALRAGDGRPLGLVAVCEDLSEIRAMEDRVRQADRLATLGRMAANIAHEIRNPLASLTGAIEALARPAATGEDRERLTQIVGRESERLNRIITNFLEYARPAPLVPETVDVAELVEDVLVLLEHRGLPPGLKLVRELPPALAWRADPQQLRQALWNLCLNAVEAMPGGGELRLAATVEGDVLRLTVSDTGEGIAAADLPHVFEPFFSTKPGGSGLGLALVERIVRDHGGEVALRSLPGAGTTVTLTLPARHG